jgi:hypothetical protein
MFQLFVMRKLFMLVALFVCLFTTAPKAQSIAELNTLRRINPNNPNSAVWNNLSNTSKYISVGVCCGTYT